MKVPEPRKLKSGTWFIQLRLDGESIPVTDQDKTMCIKKAELIKAEYRNGKREKKEKAPEIPTLGAALDSYIAKYEEVLSPATIRGYYTVRRNRFKDHMDLQLDKIDDWQDMINSELKLACAKTVKNGWGVVTATLNDMKYPVPDVKLAKPPSNELSFLEPEEIPPFLEAVKGDSCELEILLELHSLRHSEALQVVRNNLFDLKHHVINVKGAVVPNKKNKLVEKKTNKTDSSERIVPIMIPRLSELVAAYQKSDIKIPVHSSPTILKHVHQACARAGVTDVTNHGLRRTCASLGYSLGLSERAIMDIGGWDDPDTMHKLYIKLAKRDRTKTKSEISNFYSSIKPKTPEELLADAVRELEEVQEKYKDLKDLQPIFKSIAKVKKKLDSQNAN